MKSHNTNILLTIILLLEGFFCAELKDMPVKKSDKYTGYSQIELNKDVSFVPEVDDVKKTEENNYSTSSSHSDEDDSNSSSHSAETIFCSFKNLIEKDVCSSDIPIENDVCSSKIPIENDVCSSEIPIEKDDGDYELDEDYSFEQSTTVYLMGILLKCKEESEAVNVSYNEKKLLRFFDGSIESINLFIKVFSWKKTDSMIVLWDKVKKITENFNFLDNAILEIKEIINGVLKGNRKSNLRKMLIGLNKFKKRFGNVKKTFEWHKKNWSDSCGSSLVIDIEVLNNYKEELIDKKGLIMSKGKLNIKNQIDNLKKTLLKNIIEDFESFYYRLKKDHDVLTFGFSTLNHLSNW